MNVAIIPKLAGRPIPALQTTYDGSGRDTYRRAYRIVITLTKLFPGSQFTVRIDRADKPHESYEIGPDGHTIKPT